MKGNFLQSLKNVLFNKQTADAIIQSFAWTITGSAPHESPLGGLLLQVPPFDSLPTYCPACYIKRRLFPHPTWRQWLGPRGRGLPPVGTVSETGQVRGAAGSILSEGERPASHLSSFSVLSPCPRAPSHRHSMSPAIAGASYPDQLLDTTPGRRLNLDFVSNSWHVTGVVPSAATTICMATTKYMLQHGPWMTQLRHVTVNTMLTPGVGPAHHSLPEHPHQLRVPSPPGLPQTLSPTTMTMTSVRVWISYHDMTYKQRLGHGASAEIHLSMYEDCEVVVKVFKPSRCDLVQVYKEADIAWYMGGLGVGPLLLGMMGHPALLLPCIVSASLPGAVDLEKLLMSNTHHMNIHDIFSLMAQVARLITVMHTRGFLHNDIKANNVLVVRQLCACPENTPCTCVNVPTDNPPQPCGATGMIGNISRYRAYLIDFGTATYGYGYLYHLSAEGREELQRFPYLAPEVANGHVTTTKSDVYSFGIMLSYVCKKYIDWRLQDETHNLIEACTKASPDQRLPMADVERVLEMTAIRYKDWK